MSRSVFIFLFTMLSSILSVGCIESRCSDEGNMCLPLTQSNNNPMNDNTVTDIEIAIDDEDNQYVDTITMRTRKTHNEENKINAWIGLSLRERSSHKQHTVLLSVTNNIAQKQRLTTPCTMSDSDPMHKIGIIMTDSYLMFPCNDQSETNPSLNKYYFDNQSQDINRIMNCSSIWSLSSNNHGDAFGMLRDKCNSSCNHCSPLGAIVSGASVMQANILDLTKINNNSKFSAQLALFGHFTNKSTPDWIAFGQFSTNGNDNKQQQVLRALVPAGFSFIDTLSAETAFNKAADCISSQSCTIATGHINNDPYDDIAISRNGEIKFHTNTQTQGKESTISSFTEETNKKITIDQNYINDAIALSNDDLGRFLLYSKRNIMNNKITIVIHKLD